MIQNYFNYKVKITDKPFTTESGNKFDNTAAISFLDENKAIVGLCMSPTTIAKAVNNRRLKITVGSDIYSSPYEIKTISNQIES